MVVPKQAHVKQANILQHSQSSVSPGKLHENRVDTCNRKISYQPDRLKRKVSFKTYSSWLQKNNKGLFMNLTASCKESEIINCTTGHICPQRTEADKIFWHLTNITTQYLIFFFNSEEKQYKNNASKCKKIQSNQKGTAIPVQIWKGSDGSRRFRLPDFMTVGRWRLQGCQSYVLSAFSPRKYSWF